MQKFVGKSRMSAILSTLYLMKEHTNMTIIQNLITEISKIDSEFKIYMSNNIFCESHLSEVLEPGKYYILTPEGEKKIILDEQLFPEDNFYSMNIFKHSNIYFGKDQIRRFIKK